MSSSFLDKTIGYSFNPAAMMSGLHASFNESVVAPISSFSSQHIAPHVESIASYLGRIVSPIALGLSRLSSSVDGLSDLLRVAVSTDALFRAISPHSGDEPVMITRFNEYRTIADVTRVLDAPSYFLGDDIKDDARQGRWFEMASRIIGSVMSFFSFGSFVYDCQVKPYLETMNRMGELSFFQKGRQAIDGCMSIASIVTNSLSAAESVRDVYTEKTESISYSLLRAVSKVTEGCISVLDLVPVKGAPIISASLAVAASSLGIVTFFLDPQS